MKKITMLFAVLTVLLFNGCLKNELPIEAQTPFTATLQDAQFQAENFGNIVQGNFTGVISNQSSQSLEGVLVKIGNAITTTDRNGVFVLNNVDVYENFAYITAEKQGFIHGSRVVIPKTNSTNYIDIRLFQKEVVATINSGEESRVDVGVSKINFPGAFVDSNNNPYNGPVDVVARRLSANEWWTPLFMPGSLYGQTNSNDAVGLESYGMMSVNLFSPSGERLNIDENFPATIEMYLSFSQRDIAPETIKLWYFDEEVGYWKEEGEAAKQGDYYIGEVSHFSWWNCDVPFDGVELCVELEPTNIDYSAQFRMVMRRTLNDQIVFSGRVNSGVLECGLVPRNEELEVFIYGTSFGCFSQLMYQGTIGGFSTNSSQSIQFEVSSLAANITGTVTNCAGNPLVNGYIFIDGHGIESVTDGIINFSIPYCSDEVIDLQIYDFNSQEFAIVENISLSEGIVDISNISTCGNSGGFFNGNVTLLSQEDVNQFGLFNYAKINGSITIGDFNNTSSDITDLSPLSSLEEITERLTIINNNQLENLSGLENLTEVGILNINQNNALNSLSAVTGLTFIERFWFTGNSSLMSLSSLENMNANIQSLSIFGSSFSSLEGLSNSTVTGSFYLRNNDSLVDLTGLNVGNSLDWVDIINNNALVDLTGITGISRIGRLFVGENDALESLDGLENLIENTGIYIGYGILSDIIEGLPNNSLNDLCALQNLFANGTFEAEQTSGFRGVHIDYNLFNPTYQMIAEGNCRE